MGAGRWIVAGGVVVGLVVLVKRLAHAKEYTPPCDCPEELWLEQCEEYCTLTNDRDKRSFMACADDPQNPACRSSNSYETFVAGLRCGPGFTERNGQCVAQPRCDRDKGEYYHYASNECRKVTAEVQQGWAAAAANIDEARTTAADAANERMYVQIALHSPTSQQCALVTTKLIRELHTSLKGFINDRSEGEIINREQSTSRRAAIRDLAWPPEDIRRARCDGVNKWRKLTAVERRQMWLDWYAIPRRERYIHTPPPDWMPGSNIWMDLVAFVGAWWKVKDKSLPAVWTIQHVRLPTYYIMETK